MAQFLSVSYLHSQAQYNQRESHSENHMSSGDKSLRTRASSPLHLLKIKKATVLYFIFDFSHFLSVNSTMHYLETVSMCVLKSLFR